MSYAKIDNKDTPPMCKTKGLDVKNGQLGIKDNKSTRRTASSLEKDSLNTRFFIRISERIKRFYRYWFSLDYTWKYGQFHFLLRKNLCVENVRSFVLDICLHLFFYAAVGKGLKKTKCLAVGNIFGFSSKSLFLIVWNYPIFI